MHPSFPAASGAGAGGCIKFLCALDVRPVRGYNKNIYMKIAMTGNARAGALQSEPEFGASPEKARAGESPPSRRLKGSSE